MARSANHEFSDTLATILCAAAAIFLQIQTTLFATENAPGIRINLMDLMLPFAGAGIVYTLLKKTSFWPRWTFPALVKWLCIITALLSFAFINGTLSYDEISRWALINKLTGWLVLVAILGVGGWIGRNLDETAILTFVRIFIAFFVGLMIYQIIILSAQVYEWLTFNKLAQFPMMGFMANRNAYGFLALGALCLTTCFYFHRPSKFFLITTYLFYFCLPIFALFCGSRATFITLCLLLLTFAAAFYKHGKRTLNLIFILFAGIVLTFAAFHNKEQVLQATETAPYQALIVILHGMDEKVGYSGDSMRLTILQDAFEMVQSRPLVGSGLGGMMAYQKQKHGHVINIIDCTPLWILVEMGVIGLLLFAAFYIKITASLFQSWQASEDFSRAFRLSLLFILLAFTIMSLFHEIMYTRFIWFLLGLGLALPLKMHPPAQSV